MVKYLPDMCDNLDSQRIPITGSDRKTGSIPYYGASGVVDYVEKYIFDEELLLVSEDGANLVMRNSPIAFSVSGKTWVNNHAHVLRFSDQWLRQYVELYLNSISLEPYITGTAQPKLNQQMLNNIPIPVPDESQIRYIVTCTTCVHKLISLRKQQIAKLDELVKARFVEMFGNIPAEEKKTMADVCKIITDGTHQPPKFSQTGIPFLFVSNIVTNEIHYDAEKFISEETYSELIKRTPIEIGDILLSTVGSYGHPAVVKSDRPFCFQRHIAYLKPNATMVNSEFLRGAILSADVQKQIDERVKGIAQKTLNLSEIRKLQLPIPLMEQQEQFAAFVEQTDKSKLTIQQSLDKLELMKKALMQKYFG